MTSSFPRQVSLPAELNERLAAAAARRGFPLSEPEQLAQQIVRLSDFYLERPDAPTPWEQSFTAAAYLAYFLPLNYLRLQGVISEAQRLGFFAGLTEFLDFGSGAGTMPLALDDRVPGHFSAGMAVERSAQAAALHKELMPARGATPLTWGQTVPKLPRAAAASLVATFSYSLTELSQLPTWTKACAGLILVEPATHQDSRRLLTWRSQLLADGWHVWGPCTHAGACPLLAQSGRDWCHDRIAWEKPDWFSALEEHLPMRNDSLAFSYLLLRRTPPPPELRGLARLTGDLRREKGASRQMVCRGPNREFLSWQHKLGEPQELPRGALVRLADGIETKSNELRLRAGDCTPLAFSAGLKDA